jgi:hypothetical protein
MLQNGNNSVTKRLEPAKYYVACRSGIRLSIGKPEGKYILYVIGVAGGMILKCPFKK